MDGDNRVIKLCADGMAAEGEGRPDDARRLFEEAWAISADDFDACIAAHYVARHQPTPELALEWNREALRRADAIADERVRGFYPSLFLNVARSLELLGETRAACEHFAHAAARLEDLPPDGYGSWVRLAVANGQQRTGGTFEEALR